MSKLNPLTWKKAPAPATGQSPLEMLKATIGNLKQLPMLPDAAQKAIAIAKDPNSSMKKFAAVVESDPALATSILKLANSSFYGAGRSIDSLDRAVVRLGLRECQNLVITVSMRSLFRKVISTKQHQCEILWRHSFITACICRHLTRSLGLPYQGEEFACGLFHDIGRILTIIGAPDHFDAADPMDFQEGPDVLAREQKVLGTDHCFFGAWFADLNQLPHALISAVQFHHTPASAADHQALVALVATADHMANYIQREQVDDGYDAGTNTGLLSLSQNWTDDLKEKFTKGIPVVMVEAVKEAQEMTGFAR